MTRQIKWLFTVLLVIAAGSAGFSLTGIYGSEAELRLELDRSDNELSLYQGDERIRRFTVSVGKHGHETPLGSYRISHLIWNPWWHPPQAKWARNKKVTPPGPDNPMGRVKLYFAPELYIHGTQETSKLGEPASHGCVRLANEEVIELAETIHRYGAPQSAGIIDRLIRNPKMTREIRLKTKVPLRIVE